MDRLELTGHIFFASESSDGVDMPLHHVQVAIWHLGATNDYCCAVNETDLEGRYALEIESVDLPKAGSLELRVTVPTHQFRPDGDYLDSWKVIHVHPFSTVVLEQGILPPLHVPFWSYDPHAPTPRLHGSLEGGPYQFSDGTLAAAADLLAQIEPIHQQHLMLNKYVASQPKLAKIQKAYAENKTILLEQETPGVTRGDAYFGQRVLNGMWSSNLDQHPDHPEQYWIYHHWHSYQKTADFSLPDVDIRFELKDDQLLPTQITVSMQGGTDGQSAPKLRFTPADGDRWERAKHVARMSLLLQAEIDSHLTHTHLNLEQYALPLHRNLRRNPLRRLLFPHLKEVSAANRQADKLLLGENGFLANASALTAEALTKRVVQGLGMLDWHGWQPRSPLCESHHFAQMANLYWDLLGEYVEQFFSVHHAEIVAEWVEVRRFSDELVNHSVRPFLCQHLNQALNSKPIPGWFNQNERIKPRCPSHSAEHVMSPVTASDIPEQADLANMKQLCRYVIMHGTFMHSWANREQYADSAEIAYAGAGLRFTADELMNGFGRNCLPPPRWALEQPYLGYFLSEIKFGTITKNEEQDISPEFVTLLERHAADFATLGFDIHTLNSRINI